VARVRAADGILRLDPLTASLYGGEYRGTVTVDATGDTAQVSLDQELVAVQIEEVLQGYFDTDVLAGALTMRLAGSGAGNTTDDLLRGLGADVSFDLADGVYRGTDMVYELQRARALVKKEAAPTPPENPVTPIRALSMQGRMADGVLQTKRLSAETSAVQLLGRGGLNLLDLDLDYTLDAKVLASAASAAKLGDLANLTIPLTLKGPIAGPKVGVDMQGLLTNALRDTARQKAEAALLKRLGGDKPAQPDSAATDAAPGAEPAAAEPARKPSAKDQLRQGLKDLLRERSSSDESGADPSGG
jgi:AsmA protein